jgi:Mg2+/Co2+ transporter CorB
MKHRLFGLAVTCALLTVVMLVWSAIFSNVLGFVKDCY